MPSKISKNRVFKLKDFKAASRIEKLHIYMMQPEDFHLCDRDFKYLEDLKKIFHILTDHMSLSVAMPLIRVVLYNDEIANDQRIYRMINHCKELFGNIIEKNKRFDRAVIKEKYILVYEKALAAGELDTARLALSNIVRLDGLDIHEAKGLNPEDFVFPDLIASSDPKLLSGDIEEAQIEAGDPNLNEEE